MNHPFVLFEISWEVCNKVGGIHTVLTTKAATAVEEFGDDYIAIGPWTLSDTDREVPFDEEPGFEAFAESCRSIGIPVRVGRWRTPGRPRTILVEFSGLYDHNEDVLAKLWEDFKVDSISGGWDYIEPVMFGHAAGRVIERWWEEYVAPRHRRAVVHAHEWMTGSALLYLKPRVPSVGTVFTTHATMLGRALSSLGHSPSDGIGDDTPEGLASEHNVVAKHSIEGVLAREADVFTTVSEITAAEAELLHRRPPDPLLPNGIDLSVLDQLADHALPRSSKAEVRATLADFASRFCGEDVSKALLCCVSGRYEFHNKGIDVLLEAVTELQKRQPDGRPMVVFITVPAGNSGLRREVRDRLDDPKLGERDGPIGISTHNLFDEETDPVQEHCRRLGLDNARGSRIKIIQVPIYLEPDDGLWNLSYEAVLRAMDLSCFPSYYEPWGYTPQESLAVGVPTITSDYAGFGRWALANELGAEHGVTVLKRVHREYRDIVESLVEVLESHLSSKQDLREACRETASRTAWTDLFDNYRQAYQGALENVTERSRSGVIQTRRAQRSLSERSIASEATSEAPRLSRFEVAATLPKELQGLERLARNFWWCWDNEARSLFEELSPQGWAASGNRPIVMLQDAFAQDLKAKASDPEFVKRLSAVLERLDAYVAVSSGDKFSLGKGLPALSHDHPVAYFSAEFGVHESLPIYSGGLGILAGDHLKSASDINLPLIGVGLFYRMGYMAQRLTASGEQVAVDIENDPRRMALDPVRNADGSPLEVHVRLPGRELALRAWRARVGRVSLYLLDADTPTNRSEDRDITRNLYGGDHETRILQEIVLGRGGARLLRKLGLRPSVWHMNEGHAAFLTLERVARLVGDEGLTFDAAREYVRATTTFTTHTPVPAGHDRFGEDLMRRYFSDAEDWVGLPWAKFLALGRTGKADQDSPFNMTYLAMNFASYVNGVSKLHGIASRTLLKPAWPGLLEDELPIDTITNGIHLPTWTHPGICRVLGVSNRPVQGEDFVAKASKIDVPQLWSERQAMKRTLIERASASIEQSFVDRSDSPIVLHDILEGLDDNALVIGFARRFAPYKRAHLLFKDLDRLARLLDDSERPLRILFSGKAHPADQHGQSILKEIVELTRSERFRGRVFFLEDYDMNLARALVQGVDVWLNNPTRMLEASGTSGMKAAANGALNLSIGDGWWPEAADGNNGWTIAGERVYEDQELQDQFDSSALYRLLEEELLPLYFKRDAAGVPTEWMQRVVHDLLTVPAMFQTDRMVSEYFEKAYRGAARSYLELNRDRKTEIQRRSRETTRLRRDFGTLRVIDARVPGVEEFHVGDLLEVHLEIDLGALRPDDVVAELVLGHAGGQNEIRNIIVVPLKASDDSATVYEGSHRLGRSGSYAHGLRLRAADHGLTGSLRDLVVWA